MKHISLSLCHSRLSAFFLAEILVPGILLVLFSGALYAQTTSIQLPSVDSSSSFRVLNNSSVNLLRLNGDAGFYFGGTFGTGTIPTTGAGSRLMWYPAKAAFRAGSVDGSQWDDANIGINSTAMGFRTTANNDNSTAMGANTIASGEVATAMGSSTTASGTVSTAMGYSVLASGYASTAMGYFTTAGGQYSTAMGYTTTASGDYSTAMGRNTTASGPISTAIGEYTTASGNRSVAIGCADTASGWYSTSIGYRAIAGGDQSMALGNHVSTNTYAGACIIGDDGAGITAHSSASNQMTMRFANGYRLFTNSGCTTGATLAPGGSSWGTVSDSTKKTNFEKADGAYFLNSLSKLKLGSWNYIGQDAKTFRHYGPMAQEIFHYFGKDAYGIIGNDTTLATADMDGIMMVCLQALEKRTAELKTVLDELKIEKEKVAQLQTSFDELNNQVAKMKSDIQSLTENISDKSNNNLTLDTINKGQ